MMDIEHIPDDAVLAMKEYMEEAMSANTKRAFDGFLSGRLPYFKFPKDTPHEISLSLTDKNKERAQRKNAIIRLLAVRDFLNGYITAYESENGGEYLREVTPKIHSQVGSQGASFLPYHSDMAYLKFPGESAHPNKARAPDFLVLSCIRNSEKVGTHIVEIEAIKRKLGDQFEDLKQHWYSFQSPDSVKPMKMYQSRPIVFTDSKGAELARWEKCLPNNLNGADAFSSLFLLLKNMKIGQNFILEPGETLVFDNRRCLHGRKEIKKLRNVDSPRLLLRIYVNKQPFPEGQSHGGSFYRQKG